MNHVQYAECLQEDSQVHGRPELLYDPGVDVQK